jgi:hypothetical protein
MSDAPQGAASLAAGRGPAWAEHRFTVMAVLALSAVLFAGAAAVLVTYWALGPLQVGHSSAWSHHWTEVTSGTALVAVLGGGVLQVLTVDGSAEEIGPRRWWRARRALLEVVAAQPRGASVPEEARRAATVLARRAWSVLPAAGSAVGMCGTVFGGAGNGYVRTATALVITLMALCAVLGADTYRGARLLGHHSRPAASTGAPSH